MIQISNLQKKFSKKNMVLDEINLDIKDGEFHGLFGKNGAGKTTLFKLILGLQSPTKGEILVKGSKPPYANRIVGFLPENITIYSHLSAEDNLRVAAYSANEIMTKEKASSIIEKLNLEHASSKTVNSFSLGMKRRLQLGMATMVKPTEILILDEPTNGLDINGVIWLKKFLKELHNDKKTIIICSHSLEMVEELVTDFSILNKGKIIIHEEWKEANDTIYRVEFDNIIEPEILTVLSNTNLMISASGNKFIEIKSELSQMEVTKLLYDKNIYPKNITKEKRTLEKIFTESVGA